MNTITPFEIEPAFCELDHRKNRGFNPVTGITLEAKMKTLLPEWLIQGKRILDLGSCLGAAGHWSLFYGASEYIGLEIQKEYVSKSRKLLSRWPQDQWQIVEEDFLKYLHECEEQSFDVVLASGVLYLFVNQEEVIKEMSRVAREYVVIETRQPNRVCNGSIDQNAPIIELCLNQSVNLSEMNKSLTGIAASATVPALDILFGINGMRRTEALLEYPVTTDTVIYTEANVNKGNVIRRFAARYKRSGQAVETLQTSLPKNSGVLVDWNNAEFAQHLSERLSAASQRVQDTFTPWAFDEKVAEQFDTIANTSIPNYWQVLEKTVNIARCYPGDSAKIIDIGCATGNTLRLLHDAGFKNLYGVDSSEEMLKKVDIPAELVVSDKLPVEFGPYDIIIANWVLHFIDNRVSYLTDIYRSLQPGGYFILTEKVSTTELTNELYFDFKRKQGLSNNEIEEKRRRLAGVLRTYPLTWYLQALEKLGFASVEVFDASFSFASILAVK